SRGTAARSPWRARPASGPRSPSGCPWSRLCARQLDPVRSPDVARFLSPRWLVRHAVAAGLVAAFLALGWWQVRRAAGGNVLSYAYAVEWPLFAAFVVALWTREVRAELRPRPPAPAPAPPVQPDARGYVPFTASRPERVPNP